MSVSYRRKALDAGNVSHHICVAQGSEAAGTACSRIGSVPIAALGHRSCRICLDRNEGTRLASPVPFFVRTPKSARRDDKLVHTLIYFHRPEN